MRAITFLSPSQAKRLAAGRCVIGKIGEEHDGQQLVVRLTPKRPGPGIFDGVIEVSITQWEWDHGGCMIGEERRDARSQHNLAASPPASAGLDGRAASALPAPPSPHQLRHRRSAGPSGGGEVERAGTEPQSEQAQASSCRDGATGDDQVQNETPARQMLAGDVSAAAAERRPGVDRTGNSQQVGTE